MPKLDDVLKTFRQPAEKVAVDRGTVNNEKTAAVSDSLKSALKDTLAEVSAGQTKTASTADPQKDLEKVAAEVANAEHEALVKRAQLFGAAVYDGLVARAAQYQGAIERTPASKTAAVSNDFDKFAHENPELIKQAAEVGFSTTSMQLDQLHKVAAAKGEKDATEWVFKTAHDTYLRGYGDTFEILKAAAAR